MGRVAPRMRVPRRRVRTPPRFQDYHINVRLPRPRRYIPWRAGRLRGVPF